MDINSTDEELINECQILQSKQMYSSEERELRLNYCLGLLSLKQQRKLLDVQNKFNEKLLNTNRWLVIATWVLAIATIVLVIASN